MSLESQLTLKAAQKFNLEYAALFKTFTRGFAALTGFDLEGSNSPPADLQPFKEIQRLMYYGGNEAARKAADTARAMHAERYIAEFVAKAEETFAFVESAA